METAPTLMKSLRSDIAARHSSLSDRLQHIAEFALENPTEMALGTVAEVAKRASVQPSAIVRFASALGYSGFTEMQQVFRLRLVASLAPSYKDRIGRLKHDGPWRGSNEPQAVLGRFVTEGIASLETLNSVAREQDLRRAIDLLGSADTIFLLGLGGSYPVAAHLAYVLRKLGRRTVLLDALGGGLATGGGGDPRRRAAGRQLQAVQCRYGSSFRRTDRAWRARRLDHRQSPEPDRARRRRSCSSSTTWRSRRCARWWRRCRWPRPLR